MLAFLQEERGSKQGRGTGGQPCEVCGLAPCSCVPNLPLPVQLSWAPGIKHDETHRKQNKQGNHNNASRPQQQSSQTRSSHLLWLEHRLATGRRARAAGEGFASLHLPVPPRLVYPRWAPLPHPSISPAPSAPLAPQHLDNFLFKNATNKNQGAVVSPSQDLLRL